MLEIRNITKIYHSKTGESVRALDNVSIRFPENGMVFLLGKSGSGKSTLLNVMGGLDSYDSGEFVIMGKSSSEFGGSDFDAYRNTFVGFIFQEYNVLDEFTVGANIALALELQGKKATNEAINEILTKVDLAGYGARKPNELSGGQKQRVAIARALVKDPQIIMADEPTGALDSNTGKQIFDTLKALSREKLVLVVSHDRDFAEKYADRIIELSDGRVIEDVSKQEHGAEQVSTGIQRIGENMLRIEEGYRLTAKDLQMINDYLAQVKGDVILSGDARVNEELRAVKGVSREGGTATFERTVPERDIKTRKYEKGDAKFIRSRLPMKNAVKMGASGLRHKKFRLVMTIFLSLISFAMFGLADTMAAYDQISQATASVLDSHVRNASMQVSIRYSTTYDGKTNHYYNSTSMNEQDLAWLREQTGLDFVPVYTGMDYMGMGGTNISLSNQMIAYENNDVYKGGLSGLVAMDADMIAKTGFKVTGRLPQAENEIAIPELLYRQFNEYGFCNSLASPAESVEAGKLTMSEDGSANSIIGKHISFGQGMWVGDKQQSLSYEIVGVINTEFDYERYESFLPTDDPTAGGDEGLMDYVLRSELAHELSYGFHALGFMTEQGVNLYATQGSYRPFGTSMNAFNTGFYVVVSDDSGTGSGDHKDEGMSGSLGEFSTVVGVSDLKRLGEVIWLDGRTSGALGKNEILVPSTLVEWLTNGSSATVTLSEVQMARFIELCGGEEIFALSSPNEKDNLSLMQVFNNCVAIKYIREMLSTNSAVKDRVEQDMQNEGYVGSAESFWIEKWLLNGEQDYPGYVVDEDPAAGKYDTLWINYWNAVDNRNKKALVPFLNDLTGLSLTADMPDDLLNRFYELLDRFYMDERTAQLENYDMFNRLQYYFAYFDVMNEGLWENEAFVDLIVQERFNVQSHAEWNGYDEAHKQMTAYWFFANYYAADMKFEKYYDTIHRPTHTNQDIQAKVGELFEAMTGVSAEDRLATLVAALYKRSYETDSTSVVQGFEDLKIAGYFKATNNTSSLIVSDEILSYYKDAFAKEEELMHGGDKDYKQEIAEHEDGMWAFAIAPMPTDRAAVRRLMELHYEKGGADVDVKFSMHNAVMSTLGSFDDMIEVLAQVFLWVGLGFAVFSSFLLMNFISTSISYKKREIGILRAVGARSSDVFKIFFSESFIIALINFVLAVAASLTTVILLNGYMRGEGINITLLNFGVRQVALMLGVSVVVALLASFLPVWRIAKKKPVDAIKDR